MKAALPNCPDEGNFIILNGHEIASIDLLLRSNNGQLSFAKYRKENLRLNLRMCESSLDTIMAELVDCFCQQLNSTNQTSSLIEIIGQCSNYWVRHRLKQFLHDALFSEILNEDVAWNGNHDFRKVYCYRSSDNQLAYYSTYERGDLLEFVMSNAVIALEVKDKSPNEELRSANLTFYIGK